MGHDNQLKKRNVCATEGVAGCLSVILMLGLILWETGTFVHHIISYRPFLIAPICSVTTAAVKQEPTLHHLQQCARLL